MEPRRRMIAFARPPSAYKRIKVLAYATRLAISARMEGDGAPQ